MCQIVRVSALYRLAVAWRVGPRCSCRIPDQHPRKVEERPRETRASAPGRSDECLLSRQYHCMFHSQPAGTCLSTAFPALFPAATNVCLNLAAPPAFSKWLHLLHSQSVTEEGRAIQFWIGEARGCSRRCRCVLPKPRRCQAAAPLAPDRQQSADVRTSLYLKADDYV
jgi:hypothetical protein